MIVKLLTEHHLEFLSLKGGCRGSSESTHVKMPHCWKSHAAAHFRFKMALISAHLELELLSRGNEEADSGTMEHRQELTCPSP